MNILLRKSSIVATLALLAISPRLVPAEAGSGVHFDTPVEADFPYVVPVETWSASEGFRRGDSIRIHLVRGDRRKIEPGGKYLVQGTFTLASAAEGTLALSLTSNANGGRSSWSETQRMKIAQGDGSFSLSATMHARGEFHVSLYLADPQNPNRSSSQGGIYFDNR